MLVVDDDELIRKNAESILRPLLSRLEAYYGVKPIIYTTLPVYFRYVRGSFSDYPLWIRSVGFEPDLMDWKFWQYSDKGRVDGISGNVDLAEGYIDYAKLGKERGLNGFTANAQTIDPVTLPTEMPFPSEEKACQWRQA